MRTILAALALVLPATAAAAPAPPQGTHEEPSCGYQFRPPKGWKRVALQTGEPYLTAKYRSDKTYHYTDEVYRWTWEHTPEMVCVALLPDGEEEEEEPDVEEVEDGEDDGEGDGEGEGEGGEEGDDDEPPAPTRLRPYRDYEEFLDRTYVGGGWHVAERTEEESKGVAITKFEVKVEKGARTGPKRILTWVYHAPGVDFALQTEVLEDDADKLRRSIETAYRSFRLIDREGVPPWEAEGGTYSRSALDAGTPEQRRELRYAAERRQHELAVAGLPDDWDHLYEGSILVVHHDEERWAKKLGEHAAAFLAWLDETFPYVGEGEYVRAPILRVCKDWDEEQAFTRGARAGSDWFYIGGSEIITHKDDDGFVGWEVDWTNRRLLQHWMSDRDSDLYYALPQWLGGGLADTLENVRMDGRKVKLRADGWDRDNSRLAVSQGRATPPREIMKLTRAEFQSRNGDASWEAYFDRRAEAAMLVEFLLSKDAQRCSQAKDLLERYLEALCAAVDEREAGGGEEAEDAGKPETEEEEAARAKARAEALRKREKELLIETFERVFAGWSERDWERFHDAYFDYIS